MKKELPTWDLSLLFPSLDSKEYTAMKSDVTKEADGLSDYKDIFSSFQEKRMIEAIQAFENIQWKLLHIYAYPHMTNDVDTSREDAKSALEDAKQLLSTIESKLEWFVQGIKNMDEDLFNKYIGSEDVAIYKHLLIRTRIYKPYTLTEREEQLLSQKDLFAKQAWSDFHTEVASHVTFDPITIDGERKEMNQALLRYYSKHADGDVRKAAFFSRNKGFAESKHIFAYLYKQVIASFEQDTRKVRGFDSGLHAATLGDEVEVSHVETMVEVTKKYVPLYQGYYEWKKKQLGMSSFAPYDAAAPLFMNKKREVSFEEAKDIVTTCFSNLDKEMGEMSQRFFDERWIDAREGGNKYAGAYSWSMKDNPFILLNYQPDMQQVFTMIHELGHGIHSLLTNKEQPYLMRDYSKVTAESASQFSEMLLLEYLLEHETDIEYKKYILAHHIEDLLYCLFSTLTVTRFEMETHENITKQSPTNEDLKNIWIQCQKDLRGDTISTLPEESYSWTAIPHIFQTPFYYYSYPMSLLIVLSLYELYMEDKKEFTPKYKRFLSLGGSMSPEDMVREAFGLEFGTEEFFSRGFAVVEKLFQRLQELA